jgi:hypothetical protein
MSTCAARGDSFTSLTCEDGCNSAGTACSNENCVVGDAACECYPNDTCNDDLECLSGLCVNPGGCLGVNNALCTTIAKFSGTQSVDGSDADFCGVPATTFNFASAEFTNVTNESADTSLSEATVRVAWDAMGLHAHVHVKDPLLQHTGADAYDGDTVQFFISSNAPTTGLTSETVGVTQITVIPAAGGTPTSIVYYGDAPTFAPTTTPTYFSDVVSDGYVVEMLWPWRADAPVGGDQIALDVMVSVEDNTLGRDFEYAYALKPLTDSACVDFYSNFESPWCEQRHWCAPTLSP